MICDKCGHDDGERVAKDPWFMYQVQGSSIISKLFDPDAIPDGWYDSPKQALEALEPKKSEVRPHPISKKAKNRKVKNGNSSRPN